MDSDIPRTRLVLAIRSLNIGGAERQFIELIKNIDKVRFDISVCTMYGGVQEDIIKSIPNITYYNLQKSGRYDFYKFYKNYSTLLKNINPDVIYSFLGEMNLFSLWAKPKHTKIIWGFRASNMDLSQYGKVSQLIFWLQKKLSNKVDKIIANSNASILFHNNSGFDMSKSVVIPNGIDTNKFCPSDDKKNEFRKKYNLASDDIAIGIVSRIDYMKGYIIFANVAKKILDKYTNVHFFCVGGGDDSIKQECQDILANHDRFVWLGEQKNVESLYAGFDIYCSTSFGEGFSNSIAEAMSCECASVVTDVGDSALIVGNFGIITRPNDIDDFFVGLDKMINSDYKELAIKSRYRIVDNFSTMQMVKNTEQEILKCVE